MDPLALDMDASDHSLMEEDVYGGEDDDADPQTQSTQATQINSQQPSQTDGDKHLWGYFQPCNVALSRMDFWKANPIYTIGRHESNTIVFPGFKISNHHCTLSWDGSSSSTSVIVRDHSSNGTYINGKKIGKGQSCILREGNEIAFGTAVPQARGLEDYRFIYRHLAGGPPVDGLYAYYDISNELGKGSFATVMKAMCRRTGEWYAVKMIHDRSSLSGGKQKKDASRNNIFAREISIMEKLRHPNICELKEVFFQKEENEINLVIELVEGGDLLEYILANNGLSEVDTQHVTYQVCHALSYIHAQGVAHRDLKPENILLTTHRPPIVKVADFGLAKAVDSVTMLRTMCGTPSYLAPEVVKQQNDEGYDNLVDSWSVGVIVFSMLTNAAPFVEDMSQRDIRTRIAERHVDWTILDRAGVSEEAEDFIRCLLQDDPHYRMSLTEALNHPWLLSYTPVYDFASPPLPPPPRKKLTGTETGSSIDSVAGFGGYPFETSTDEIPGMIHSAKREGSRLVRRSQVVAQAEEENVEMLQPSDEMVANAEAYDKASAAELYKGPGKRVYAELTPVSENDEGMSSTGPIAGKAPRGKGRMGTRQSPRSDEEGSSGSRPRNKQARRG